VWRTSSTGRNLFLIAPVLHTGAYHQLKEASGKYFRLGVIFALLFSIIFFQSFKQWQKHAVLPVVPEAVVVLNVEDIPATVQAAGRPVPPLPAVPIPSDEPSLPADLTIEKTDLDFSPQSAVSDSSSGSDAGYGSGQGSRTGAIVVLPPRPIADVFPEYPVGEKKRGTQGEIELTLLVDDNGRVQNVQVLRNTTQSLACEEAAVQAAYQTRFMPARSGQEPVAVWIHKTYKFSLN